MFEIIRGIHPAKDIEGFVFNEYKNLAQARVSIDILVADINVFLREEDLTYKNIDWSEDNEDIKDLNLHRGMDFKYLHEWFTHIDIIKGFFEEYKDKILHLYNEVTAFILTWQDLINFFIKADMEDTNG